MNIALIRRKFKSGGGAERVASKFASEFTGRGHSVTVFSESFEGETKSLLKWHKVPKSIFPSLCRTASFHRSAQRELKKFEFDVTYSLCRTFPVDVFRVTEQLHSEWMPIRYGVLAPFLPRHRNILKLEKQALSPENTRYVVTNSNLVRNQVIGKFNYPPERISIVRNGVDKDIFFPPLSGEKEELRRKLSLPGMDSIILLFVAGNFRIKGLEEAIKTLAEIKDSGIKLCVAGGDSPSPYIAMAEKLGVSENLIFIGKKKRMREWYAASDLLFYPSLYEPFANVCLEAFACGLPVLTTRLNGSSEIVTHGINGFLVDTASNINDMAGFVNDFRNLDTTEREAFSREAVDAVADYNWENHASELEKIFEKIIAEKKP